MKFLNCDNNYVLVFEELFFFVFDGIGNIFTIFCFVFANIFFLNFLKYWTLICDIIYDFTVNMFLAQGQNKSIANDNKRKCEPIETCT